MFNKINDFLEERKIRGYAKKILSYHGLDSKCERATTGVFHHVFISDDGVVRIPKGHTKHRFYDERWAMERAAERGVPVPDVIAVEESGKVVPVSYMLESRLSGEVHKPDDMTPDMYRAAGRALAKIHSVPVSGFGRLDHKGVGAYRSWNDVVSARRRSAESSDSFGDLSDMLNLFFADFLMMQPKPGLLHGDYWWGNFLFENEKLTGVLDFNPRSGTPYLDIGCLAFRISSDALKFVEEGYGSSFDERKVLLGIAGTISGKLPNMQKHNSARASALRTMLGSTFRKLYS